MRSHLFTRLLVKECSVATFFLGALGNATLLKKRVKIKAIQQDQDTSLFVSTVVERFEEDGIQKKRSRTVVRTSKQTDLQNYKGFWESSGYKQIKCDLAADAAGHKTCTAADYRLTVHQAGGGKPLMFIQQMKGKEAKGQVTAQALQPWHTDLREACEELKKDFEVIFVYFTTQPVDKSGWAYVARQADLLIVPRQTMQAFLPAVQDRLAVDDLIVTEE